jgi:hypothetical protein
LFVAACSCVARVNQIGKRGAESNLFLFRGASVFGLLFSLLSEGETSLPLFFFQIVLKERYSAASRAF